MIKFIIGLLVGGFIGTMWMAMACIVDDIDDLAEMMEEETEESEELGEPEGEELEEPEGEEYLCPFCGGHLSEARIDAYGREYRYCFGCFHEYKVNDDA